MSLRFSGSRGRSAALGAGVLVLLVACAPPPRVMVTGNPAASAGAIAEAVCATCHGSNGIGVSEDIPSLAGQTEPYLARQLEDFRGHRRSGQAAYDAMWGMSYRLTEAQARELASLFARMPPMRSRAAPGAVDARDAEHRAAGCGGCHGAGLRGSGATPRLAGQHAVYLARQLSAFQRAGERPDADAVAVGAHRLDPAEIEAVAGSASRLRAR